MTFLRNKESFTCENCDLQVSGDGYTNHCPACLVSKHVDESPGDRKATCGGLMRVVGFETKRSELRMIHECEVCQYLKTNRVQEEDDREKVAEIMKTLAEQQRDAG